MTDATPNKSEIRELFDATAYDSTGDKLGSIHEVFLDDRSGQPTFVEVNHGLFGLRSGLVPLRGSSLNAGSLNLGFTKDSIKDAPNIDTDDGLSVEEEDAVYAHYGLTDAQNVDYFHPDTAPVTGGVADTSTEVHPDAAIRNDNTPESKTHTESPIREDAENPAETGLGAGAPTGARRSDADTTITAEPAVDGSTTPLPTETPETAASTGKHTRRDVVEGKAPGDFDRPFERFPLRRFSDRPTGTTK